MIPNPQSYQYDFWIQSSEDATVEISCLMPNGLFIPMEVNRNATLQEVKEDLWEEASKYPLHGLLHDASIYVFMCINSMAEPEELHDENRRLCDVKPFCCILKVSQRVGDTADNAINTEIGRLIGKGLHEFQALKNSEINDFRWKMKNLGDEVARTRVNKSWLERLYYQFPPRLADPTKDIPHNVACKLRDGTFVLTTKFENTDASFTFIVTYNTKPQQLITQILNKKSQNLAFSGEQAQNFVLKVCGQDEYLVGDVPLIQFLYIQEMIAKDCCPLVVTVSIDSIPVDRENSNDVGSKEMQRTRQPSSTNTQRKKGKHISSWSIKQPFEFQVKEISRLNCNVNRPVEVVVKAGLFHGGKSLCQPKQTTEKAVESNCVAKFEEVLKFDINVSNIPRMARLCLMVYEISKSSKGVKSRRLKDSKQELYIVPLAWVNTTVFDFKNQMNTATTLYMWTYAEDIQTDDLLHPLGTVVSNPLGSDATQLTLAFKKYHPDHTVVYPSLEKVLEFSETKGELKLALDMSEPSSQSQQYLDTLRSNVETDPTFEMHEQERKRVWELRYDCMKLMPHQLPMLLTCVEWNDQIETAEAITLLQHWPTLPVEKALELLDYAYADQSVRTFAVKCLRDVSDEDLSLYLLQLVQALKHESYLSCDLVEFLLRRALSNQKIGHYLFWHLRSEMQVASVSVRFGLILEAYCRGSQEHMRLLFRQLECLDKLKLTSDEMVRSKKDKDKAKQFLQERLQEPHCQDALSKLASPLDPRYRCKKVRVEKCKVMDSKMRPLWIVFENVDPYGEDVYVIFKNGDDLRQDMLTLQMIRIMDKLWKNEGLDLRMNAYGCISTDNRVGLIEVVLNAETIANIQKDKGMLSATSAFQKGSLLAWLKDHNPSETKLNKAIEEFTLSCAGYCVATYVLGVADRHSDNIMVKKTGQLFHIDFGHILGHFKAKFGIKRERAPFVLVHDFVHVINKGQTKKGQALEFQMFQSHCEKAFLILRKHGGLILSLFAMMISTGLPELSSEKDLNYIRDTLVLNKTEQEAIAHFRAKFDEALALAWRTSLDWAAHNVAKNNKQ
ncbi:phosphatidylinositol 4,5-bisphosphate 3-kinase catalytic subunit delta isoform [Frankliniella occidentalis]|uniref:phosphatidylinositol 3-kinase n=1 Tax=Frankliniella occidentalis TaxID=133901 RepID=A0A6J1T597_FRAOC|nr:phosphatidylinositol 4,5-bisphosphate 3-kinase catalytic subunit delta isoform [Frankliniella occidentalis]